MNRDNISRLADWVTLVFGPASFLLSLLPLLSFARSPVESAAADPVHSDEAAYRVLALILYASTSWLFLYFGHFRLLLRLAEHQFRRSVFLTVNLPFAVGLYIVWFSLAAVAAVALLSPLGDLSASDASYGIPDDPRFAEDVGISMLLAAGGCAFLCSVATILVMSRQLPVKSQAATGHLTPMALS
jgi:hypothetical protein